jgi:hypothetical protein
MAKEKKPKRKQSAKQKAQSAKLKKAHKACSTQAAPFTKAFGACMKAEFAAMRKES